MAFIYQPFKYFNPKQQMRYVLYINDRGMDIPTYMVKTADRPSIDQNPVTVDYINTEFKVKGKSRWQDISVTLYDPIEVNGARLLHDWISKLHHNSGISPQAGNLVTAGEDGYIYEYKRTLRFEAVSPHGDAVDQFLLYGAFIADAKWGNMDLSSDDLNMLDLTLSYDYATMPVAQNLNIPVPDVDSSVSPARRL